MTILACSVIPRHALLVEWWTYAKEEPVHHRADSPRAVRAGGSGCSLYSTVSRGRPGEGDPHGGQGVREQVHRRLAVAARADRLQVAQAVLRRTPPGAG